MERVINGQVLDYLRHHKLLNDQQHGFLAKRSTVTNLLECLSDWTLALDNRQSVTVAFIILIRPILGRMMRFVKKKLLHKLSRFGICGNLFKWIGEFLNNRTQCVRVGSTFSSPKQLTGGVVLVQDSARGPLLFCCTLTML